MSAFFNPGARFRRMNQKYGRILDIDPEVDEKIGSLLG